MSNFEKKYLDGFCQKLSALGWRQINSSTNVIDYAIHKDTFRRKILQLNKGAFNDFNKEKILNEIIAKLSSANENKILQYMKHGMTILFAERQTQIPLNIQLFDYDSLDNNDFNLVREQEFSIGTETIFADICLFINGIPVILLEGKDPLKKTSNKQYIEAFKQIMRYQYQVRDIFKYIQIGVAVAERYPYLGTFPNFELKDIGQYSFWKRNREEDIYHFLDPERVLEFIKYFVFFAKDKKGNKIKLIARYNQYYATRKAVDRIKNYIDGTDEKNKGLVWHWQGSGKTYTMFFTANYYMNLYHRKNPLAFFVIDRTDLETQFDTVLNSIDNSIFGDVKLIQNIEELQQTIKNVKENNSEWGLRIVMMHKFSPEKLDFNIEIDKKEVLFLIDEAHRTQYGDFASTMRKIFRPASFIGFTGTPVFQNERNTFKEFSYPPEELFMDVYFMGDSQEDGFTLPFSYRVVEEGKSEDGVKIILNEEEIKALVENFEESYSDMEVAFDADEVKQDLKSKLSKNITRIKIFLQNEKRIEKVVKYIAENLKEDSEEYGFKAMIVAVNREACIMYKKYFDKYFDTKDMSEVVMSYMQNESSQNIMDFRSKLFRKHNSTDWGKINQDTVEKFLKKKDPQVLIVTDMLLTGFDAPELKVMYLDKPIYYHRLLQAIARVNRPARNKEKGLIVDSVGLLGHINKTMSMYNHLAQENEDIKKDLMNNLLKNSKDEVKLLTIAINELKETLKKEKFDINVDVIIKGIQDQTFDPNDLKQKISDMTLAYDSDSDVSEAIRTIRAVLKKYKALGAEPDKLELLWDIKVFSLIYYTFTRLINKGRPSSHAMWDAIVKWIHESTMVTDLLPKIDTELNPRALTKVDIKNKGETGGYYHTLKNEVKKNLKNPLYVEIMKKLEHIRVEWMSRNLGLEEFLDELKKIDAEKEQLDKIGEKPFNERISNFATEYFKNKFQIEIDASSFSKELEPFSNKSRILDKDRQEIKIQVAKLVIMKIPKTVRTQMTSKEVRDLEEEITEYIISETKNKD